MPEYSTQKKDVTWHIPHKYSKEMSNKSTTVSKLLCILAG